MLTADRKAKLSLLDLVRMEPAARPQEIEKYAPTLERLLEAEGKVSAQAFVIDRLLSMGCRLVPITDLSYPPHLAHRIGVAAYEEQSQDPILYELKRVASKGASSGEIERATGVSTYRVRKRLKELLDAGLVAKAGRRYVYQLPGASEVVRVHDRKHRTRSTRPEPVATQALFPDVDLQSHRKS